MKSLYIVMGIIWRWKKSIYMLEIDILRYSFKKKIFVFWGVLFKGFGVQKDALLANIMYLLYTALIWSAKKFAL